ncbi:MAG: hypothetical protein KDA78_06955 [Planctomycetaceae bacterium]|nr:hypothetical protein [Planctomycetaceae bacterium]
MKKDSEIGESSGYVNEWAGEELTQSASELTGEQSSWTHSIEQSIIHELSRLPDLNVESLVVRRLDNDAICLQGVIRTDDPDFDLSTQVRLMFGIDKVINLASTRPTLSGEDSMTLSDEDTVVDWHPKPK